MWVRLSIYFGSFALISMLLLVLAARLLVTDTVRASLLPQQLQAPGGMIDTLAEYYRNNGSWDGVDNLMRGAQSTLRLWSRGLHLAITDAEGNPVYLISQRPLENNLPGNNIAGKGPSRAGQPANDSARNGSRLRRLPANRTPIRLPIRNGGTTVGYLEAHTIGAASTSDPATRDLFQLLSRYLIFLAFGSGLLGILFGIGVSRNLTTPLTELAAAARAIGTGDLQQRVPPRGSEEVAAVATAFNEMAMQLEEAETLRRNLMADVAHELRTPLSVLQGNLRAILDDVYTLDKSEVTRLYTQSRLLSRLVNDLHELAQAEAGQLPLNLQPMELRPLLQEVVELFTPMAEDAEIQLRATLPPLLPPVAADPVRLRQVLHNLLNNALRHTPAGGQVTIHATTDGSTEPVAVAIQIADSGEGIAPEHLPHVFDRFYRTDRARARDTGGAGLGLAIARAIVQAHRGTIRAASGGIGQGTMFTVTLPAHQ